jgi:hypothetical protein
MIVLRRELDRFLDNLPIAGGREKVGEKGGGDEKSLQDSEI